MKKLLLASAVAALSVTAAQAAPTVYGKAFLTLDAGNVEATTTSGNVQASNDVNSAGLNSNGSRIGIKGSEPLTANTDVLYQLEYGIDIDNDDNGRGQFYSRDTYLGLANKQYGTFLAGRLTSIDDNIDFATTLQGSNVADIGPTFNGERLDNALAYISPSYNGVTFMAEYAFDKDTDAGSIDNEDQFGIAASYAAGPMNVGGSYITHGDDNHIRVSGDYMINPAIKLGALYQISEFGVAGNGDKASPFGIVGDKKENTFIVGAEMKTATPWTAYGQVTLIDNVAGMDDHESMGVGIGGKYAFSKAATGHVYGGYVNSERTNVVVNGVNYDKEETEGFGIGAGLEYKF